ncbi:hypothetical protein [Krasilnikovia sp. MM14-A1259]|uniref:hypothetical protein n=1 Tax=Krasilnikovia sp. MM14-A1259 TaxID=3373539 RepID=UPI003810F5C5
MIRTLLLLPPLVALMAGGCDSVDRRAQAATDVAVQMLRAVADRDGAAACALLAPETAAGLAESPGPSCAEAVLGEDLPAPGAGRGVDVYGQWAQVRLDGGTVFLAVFRGGWRVVAAGCSPRGDGRPYDCVLGGS